MGIVSPPVDKAVTIYVGSSWIESFTWSYGLTGEETPVQFLTLGAKARAQVRPFYGSTELLCEANSENGTILLDDAGNLTIHVLGADVLVGVQYTKAVRDLEITWPDGDICRLVQGKVVISPEVTLD